MGVPLGKWPSTVAVHALIRSVFGMGCGGGRSNTPSPGGGTPGAGGGPLLLLRLHVFVAVAPSGRARIRRVGSILPVSRYYPVVDVRAPVRNRIPTTWGLTIHRKGVHFCSSRHREGRQRDPLFFGASPLRWRVDPRAQSPRG